jgi:VWFA-related protein
MFRTTDHFLWQTVRRIAFAAVAVFLAAQTGAATERQSEPVSLYLNVEKEGSLITGLGQGNFRLFLDGNPHAFRLARPDEPALVAFLVEYSKSSGYYIDDLNAAMQGFLKHALDGHWYALATFSHDLEIHTDFTKQIGEITAAYSGLPAPMWNESDTYDAVYEMLDKLGRLPGRRILVVVGSGLDTFSQHNLDEVKEKVESEDVTVFAAGLGSVFRGSYDPYLSSSARMSLLQAQAFLQMLAQKSGGFAWFPRHFNGFTDVMQGIMQSITTQYRLVYDAPVRNAGKFQKIKVEAFRIVNDKREDFRVLVREGWH